MERLTEYEWEQRTRERAAHVDYMMTAARLANYDCANFDVEHESGTWEQWRQIEAKRKADGWELAEYGRTGSMFMASGYFKRPKRAVGGEGGGER